MTNASRAICSNAPFVLWDVFALVSIDKSHKVSVGLVSYARSTEQERKLTDEATIVLFGRCHAFLGAHGAIGEIYFVSD